MLLGAVACIEYTQQAVDRSQSVVSSCSSVPEANFFDVDPADCEDPASGGASAVVAWEFVNDPFLPAALNALAAPVVAALWDTDGDGVVTDLDAAVVVQSVCTDAEDADIVLLQGRTGEFLGSTLEHGLAPPAPCGGVAIGRLTPEGEPAVVYATHQGAVVAFDPEFGVLWETTPQAALMATVQAPILADLDADGSLEVIVPPLVLEHDGRVRGELSVETNEGDGAAFGADVFDLDGDGRGEILRVNAWYNADLSTRFVSDWRDGTTIGAARWAGGIGVVARANAGDVADPALHLRDAEGTLQWSGLLADLDGNFGFPAIGDLTGDGEPEIVVATYRALVAVTFGGALLWQVATRDESSSRTGATLFDFDGDGFRDVAYSDEETFLIIDGPTGEVLFSDDAHCSYTWLEQPTVADLDLDGSAEILVGRSPCDGNKGGLIAYSAESRTWYTNGRTWAMNGWRPGQYADDLRAVPLAELGTHGQVLRGQERASPAAPTPRFDGWCRTDDGELAAIVSALNPGGVPVSDLTVSSLADGVLIDSHPLDVPLPSARGYGPILLDVDDALSSVVVRVESETSTACSENREIAVSLP